MIYFLIICLAVAIAIYLYRNNHVIDYTILDLKFKKLPKVFNGTKILQISDFHNVVYHDNNRDLVANLAKLEPDYIFFTGDAIDSRRLKFAVAYDFFKELIKIAPVYYVSGNHEGRLNNYDEFHLELNKIGVHVIDNQMVQLVKNDSVIYLYGLEDPRRLGKDDDNKNDLLRLKKKLDLFKINTDEFNILLSHRPEQFDLYRQYPFDLIFSGHAHGGQVRLPLIGGLFAPNQGILPKYTSGIYQNNRAHMVVNRGLGPSRFPFRINNHPEVILVNLTNH